MNTNQMAIVQLKILGFPLPNIRKALHKLTGITQPEMARRINVSRQTITLTINGERTNPEVQTSIADIYGVEVKDLFGSPIHQ